MSTKASRPRLWSRLPQERLLDLRLSQLGLRLEGSWLEDCVAAALARARGARHPLPSARVALQRVVLAGRRARLRDPVLPGAPAPHAPRAQHDARGRGRHARRVHAHPAPRVRPRAPARLSRCTAAALAPALRQASTKRYPKVYRPNPASRRYVQHLRLYYAQSHPDEDFAETFAVWLRPRARLAAALRRLARAEEARVRRRADGGAARSRAARAHARAGGPALEAAARRCASTTTRSDSSTRCTTRDTYDRDLRRIFSDRAPPAPRARLGLPAPQPRRDPPHGGALDGRVPVHARPGAPRHDRPRARAAAARGRLRAPAAARFGAACWRCDRALPLPPPRMASPCEPPPQAARRSASLVLMHPDLVPPTTLDGQPARSEIFEWKTEYDVRPGAARASATRCRPSASQDELLPIRQARRGLRSRTSSSTCSRSSTASRASTTTW